MKHSSTDEVIDALCAAKNELPPSAAVTCTSEDIARRAYQIYESRGRTDGCDLEDWLQAERELKEAGRR